MTTTVGTPLGVTASHRTSAPFNPATVTGLALWLDAADATKFTYGTGTQVATWIDKSPNVYTVTKTPSVNTVRTDTINGLSCVTSLYFQEQLTRAATPVRSLVDPVSFTDCMSFAVRQPTTATQGGWLSLVTTNYRVSVDDRGTIYIDVANAAGGRMSGAGGAVAGALDLISWYRSGVEMRMYRNGVQMLTKSTASGTVAAAETGPLTILCPPGGGFTGKIGEICHVARYNAADFAAIQNYLKTKWGTP